MLSWVRVCSLEPDWKCLAFATIRGSIVACDACLGSSDALKPTFVVCEGGCKNSIEGFLKELLVMGAKAMWAT